MHSVANSTQLGLFDVPLTKQCRRCKVHKSLNQFTSQPRNSDGLYSYCHDCHRIIGNKQYYRSGQGTQRRWDMRKNYGISLEQYNYLLMSQGGVCAICGQPETSRNKHGAIQDVGTLSKYSAGSGRFKILMAS